MSDSIFLLLLSQGGIKQNLKLSEEMPPALFLIETVVCVVFTSSVSLLLSFPVLQNVIRQQRATSYCQYSCSAAVHTFSLSSSWNRDPFWICWNLPFFKILPLNTSLSCSSAKIFTSHLWCPLKHDPRCLEEISLFYCYEHPYSKLHTHSFFLFKGYRLACRYLLLLHLKGNLFVWQLLFDFFSATVWVRNVVLHLGVV